MIEADRLLAERLQSKEREELTDKEKGKLFMELMEKRRKHFAALRAQEKRNKPPTKAQKKTQMEMKRVKSYGYVMRYAKAKEKKVEVVGSKRVKQQKEDAWKEKSKKEQHQESSKKQRMKEDKESDEVDEVSEDDEGKLMKHLVIKKDEDITIDAIPVATKLPVIIDYKLHKEGMLVHYQLIRADGSSKRYSSMIRMLQGIDREDLEALWKKVKTNYSDIRPKDEFESVLWGDLKVMFEPDIRSDVWRMLQGYKVTVWKLIDSSGVHFVRRNLKIQKTNIKFKGGLLGLKRLHRFLEVTTAQVHNGNYAKWRLVIINASPIRYALTTIIITESSVRRDLHFDDEDGITCLTNTEIFENLQLMGYEKLSDKLTFQKSFFSPQWKYLIHTILQCLSSKSTAWNEFGTNIASAVICLAKNQKFNFSKLIFDGMLRNLDPNSKKFLMYPRFLQLFLNNQIENLEAVFNDEYDTPSHTKKVFANMRRQGKDFSGTVTPLFPSMLASQAVEGEGSGQPSEPQHTPTNALPSHVVPIPTVASSSSHPKKTHKHRKTKRKATEISQSSGPTTLIVDETIYEERGMWKGMPLLLLA
ncbi:hypothetical protein Tco_1369152 [Tanacetum coccineum]